MPNLSQFPNGTASVIGYVLATAVSICTVFKYLSEFANISLFFVENRLAHLLGKKADLRKRYQGCESNAVVSAAYQEADKKIEVKIAKITFRRSLNNSRHNQNFKNEKRVSPSLMPFSFILSTMCVYLIIVAGKWLFDELTKKEIVTWILMLEACILTTIIVFCMVYLFFLYVTFQNRIADSFQSFVYPYYKEYGVNFNRDRILKKAEASFHKVYSDPKVLRIEKLSVRLFLYGSLFILVLSMAGTLFPTTENWAAILIQILFVVICISLIFCVIAYNAQTKILTNQEIPTYPWYREELDKRKTISKFESSLVACVDWCARKIVRGKKKTEQNTTSNNPRIEVTTIVEINNFPPL